MGEQFPNQPGWVKRYNSGVTVINKCGDDNCECNTPLKPNNNSTSAHQEFVANVWQIMDEIGNLMISKQLDYGPGNINNAHGGPINGLLVRIGDKFERLKNLFGKDSKPNHESIEDTFKDLANYGVIGLMVQRGVWPKK